MIRKSFTALLLGTALLLAACAGPRVVDVDVTAFANWPGGAPAARGSSYRFERLPSQQVQDVQRERVETLARDALAQKGLQLNPAAAAYAVQIGVNSQYVAGAGAGFGGPTIGIGTGVFSGGSGGFSSAGIGFGFPIGGAAQGDYRTELVVLIRQLQTNAVVYESRAYAQGPSGNDPAILGAMVGSALRDFPLATAGTLRSRVSLQP